MNRRLGGPQSQSGRFEEAKHLIPIGIQTLDRPICSLVTTLRTLLRLPNECQHATHTHTHTHTKLLICLALTYEMSIRSKADMMNM